MTHHAQIHSFASKILRDTAIVYDLRVRLDGEERYFILEISPARHQAFLRAVEADAGYRLEDYGKILHRGWNEPSPGVKYQFHTLYGLYPELDSVPAGNA